MKILFEDFRIIIFLVSVTIAYCYYSENLRGVKFRDLDVCIDIRKSCKVRKSKDNLHYLDTYKFMKNNYLKNNIVITKLDREIMFFTSKDALNRKNMRSSSNKNTEEIKIKKRKRKFKNIINFRILIHSLKSLL